MTTFKILIAASAGYVALVVIFMLGALAADRRRRAMGVCTKCRDRAAVPGNDHCAACGMADQL